MAKGGVFRNYHEKQKNIKTAVENKEAHIEATINNSKEINELADVIYYLNQENQKQNYIINDKFNFMAQAKNKSIIQAVCKVNKPTYDCDNLSLEQSCEIAEMAGITIDNCGDI